MRNRYILGMALTLLLVAVMAFGAIGSGAWFTHEVTVTGNTVTTGTLTMALTGELESQTDMAPGDTRTIGTLKLTNKGTLPYKFQFKLETIEDEEKLADQLEVTLESPVFGGATPTAILSAVDDTWIGYAPWPPYDQCRQEPGDEDEVTIKLHFKEGVGNNYQGAVWKGTLHIRATQVAAGWDEAFPTQ